MSRCISRHGEYSAHELVDNICAWCHVWQCPNCGLDEPYPLDSHDYDYECPASSVPGSTGPAHPNHKNGDDRD